MGLPLIVLFAVLLVVAVCAWCFCVMASYGDAHHLLVDDRRPHDDDRR